MTPETLKALQGSIEKWEKIIAGTGKNYGSQNCPLCALFWPRCRGCPVRDWADVSGCNNTPYEVYIFYDDENVIEKDKWARKELDFLRSLLPNE